MEFAPHHLPANYFGSGGDDAFVDYDGGDEAGLSLLKSPGDLMLPLYDVLALKQGGPYGYGHAGKENEPLPLFEPLLLKQRHGRHSTLARTVSLSRLRNHQQSRKMIPSRPSSSSSSASTASVAFSTCKSPSPRTPLSVKNSSNISLGKGKSTPVRSLPTPSKTLNRKNSGSLRSSPLSSSSSGRRLRPATRADPARPKPSKTLPREVEEELRVLAFDMGDGAFNGAATLIVGNPDTNCHAVFWAKPDRTEFVFHHGRLKDKANDPHKSYSGSSNKSFSSSVSSSSHSNSMMSDHTADSDKCCGCMVRGEPETSTFDIPPRLDEYRLELILGIGKSGIKMEPKLAAMVVMKLFLGMEVPEVLRMY
ncbi:hypothetical protein PG985_011578 [Apiospora marii]|uniref:Uncharacterized protein n=1 Tax=Apiospora marii TaxID=335849 RepID=A0ABR1R0N1_9PEZI